MLQGNDTVQDSDASADGGDADAVTDGTLEEAVADALAGFGGDAALDQRRHVDQRQHG